MSERPPSYVTNERYKSVSRTLFQLGGAVVAAAVVKLYSTQTLSFETILWLLGALRLYGSGGWSLVIWNRRSEMSIALSPTVAELVPAIAAFIVAAAGWGLAMYTRHQARRPEK